MMINGVHRDNITCRACRHRHPDDVSCAQAKAIAMEYAVKRAKAAAEAEARSRLLERELALHKTCPHCGGELK